jgi:pimeloyl-ACP methyl ester carboxylesterase
MSGPAAIIVGRLAALALLALAASCAPPMAGSTPAPSPPARCGQVLFVALRGSGESPTDQMVMGRTLYELFDRLRAGGPVMGYGFPYAANVLGNGVVQDAAGRLVDLMRRRASSCPAERVILGGYSLGAEVAGDALQTARLGAAAEHLAGAVLFSDPRFNPHDMATASGTFDRRYGGDNHPRPPYSSAVAPKIRSYCRLRDSICQYGDPLASKLEHGSYAPEQTCQAVGFLGPAAALRVKACSEEAFGVDLPIAQGAA